MPKAIKNIIPKNPKLSQEFAKKTRAMGAATNYEQKKIVKPKI